MRHGFGLFQRLIRLTKQPLFITLTIGVHGLIVVAGFGLWYLEKDLNHRVTSPLDGLYWAVATVTTVGYGDIAPMTALGKLLAIVLMIFGTSVSVLYTALVANALISPELKEIERLHRQDDRRVDALNHRLKELLQDLEKHLDDNHPSSSD